MHYVTQFLWVAANILWAFGEIFYPKYDYPFSPESRYVIFCFNLTLFYILVISHSFVEPMMPE